MREWRHTNYNKQKMYIVNIVLNKSRVVESPMFVYRNIKTSRPSLIQTHVVSEAAWFKNGKKAEITNWIFYLRRSQIRTNEKEKRRSFTVYKWQVNKYMILFWKFWENFPRHFNLLPSPIYDFRTRNLCLLTYEFS